MTLPLGSSVEYKVSLLSWELAAPRTISLVIDASVISEERRDGKLDSSFST